MFTNKTKEPTPTVDRGRWHIRVIRQEYLFGFGFFGGSGGFCSGGLGGGGLAGTTGAALLLGLLVLEHVLVVVYQLDKAGLGVVTKTVACLKNAGVATGASGNLFSYFLEENLHSFFVLKIAEHKTAVRRAVFLGAVDQRLGIDTQCLGLGQSGVDALMQDERYGHIGQKGVAVSLLAAKVIEFFIVSHRGD